MQQQMEVCDLDECDFLETKFVEIEKKNISSNEEYMEIIMYLVPNQGNPNIFINL